MKIWLITVGEPLPLPGITARLWRTGLLAATLASRGHEVTWWTSTVNHFTKHKFVPESSEVAVSPGLRIRFLDGPLYRRNISIARIRNHRQIARQFRIESRAVETPDVVLCSLPTLELSREAVLFGREFAVPVLLDIRDLWPDEMEARLPRTFRWIGRILFGAMHKDAKLALQGANGLIAISDAYLNWGLVRAARPAVAADAVFTHGYLSGTDANPQPSRADADWLASMGLNRDRKIFWFVGTFVNSIDLETVIGAARLLVEHRELVFALSGSGEKDAELRAKAQGLPNVVFTGWLDSERIPLVAARAYVGLGAYKEGALMSLTNKLFEYMAYGLPILLSLPGEAKSIVELNDCGLFYEPGSSRQLAEQVIRIAANESDRQRMATNARRLFDREYSAATVYGRMSDHIERVVAQDKKVNASRRASGKSLQDSAPVTPNCNV